MAKKQKKISTASAIGHAAKGLAEMAGRSSTGMAARTARTLRKGPDRNKMFPGAKHNKD